MDRSTDMRRAGRIMGDGDQYRQEATAETRALIDRQAGETTVERWRRICRSPWMAEYVAAARRHGPVDQDVLQAFQMEGVDPDQRDPAISRSVIEVLALGARR